MEIINYILTKYYGIKEVEGQGYSPTILNWVKKYFPMVNDDDIIPNCSICLMEVYKELGFGHLIKHCTPAAISWLQGGEDYFLEDAKPGDIVVLKRTGGNHVGILVRYSPYKKSVFLLGFNQNNQCNISEYKTHLIKGIRRYELTSN